MKKLSVSVMIRSVLFYAVLGLDELHEPTATGFPGHFVHCLCAVKRSPVRFTAMYDASHSTTDLISEITAFMFDSRSFIRGRGISTIGEDYLVICKLE